MRVKLRENPPSWLRLGWKTGILPVMENGLPACFLAAVRLLNCAVGRLEARRPRQPGWLSSLNLTHMPVGACLGGIALFFVNNEVVY
jgi:hypothetical protein